MREREEQQARVEKERLLKRIGEFSQLLEPRLLARYDTQQLHYLERRLREEQKHRLREEQRDRELQGALDPDPD